MIIGLNKFFLKNLWLIWRIPRLALGMTEKRGLQLGDGKGDVMVPSAALRVNSSATLRVVTKNPALTLWARMWEAGFWRGWHFFGGEAG